MAEIVQQAIKGLLEAPAGLEGKHARYHLFHRVGPWVACFSHGLWAFVFALNGVAFMAYYNVVVTLLFAIYGYLWPRRQGPKWFIHLLYFGEIPLHALLGTLYAGLGAMFWLFPLVSAIVCLVTPQFSWARKSLISAALVACSFVIGVLAITSQPLVVLTQKTIFFLFVANTISVSSALVYYMGTNQHLVEVGE